MNLEQIQEIFSLMNVRTFCERYNLNYSYIIKILNGQKKLSQKQSALIEDALQKFKEKF